MERLTGRAPDGAAYLYNMGGTNAALDRLAAYEETGLEPKEISTRRWIPVTERLPEAFVSVLVHIPDDKPLPTVHEGYTVEDGTWVTMHEYDVPITHWMPLPEPPEEEKHE